jgi:hypothetical protein
MAKKKSKKLGVTVCPRSEQKRARKIPQSIKEAETLGYAVWVCVKKERSVEMLRSTDRKAKGKTVVTWTWEGARQWYRVGK